MIDNHQKYLNYKEQFKRLNRAIANKFTLEAIFIAYSIMEDRSESVLRHSGKYERYIEKLNGKNPSIDSKIKEILKCRSNRKDMMFKFFSDDFLDKVLSWKEERNIMVHALLKQRLTGEELEGLALRGREYAKIFCNRSTAYRRALDRTAAKQQ